MKSQHQLAGITMKLEDGWIGCFTRKQGKGAIPNGTRIEKTGTVEGDANPDGAQGVVLGSVRSDEAEKQCGERYIYFVEWDDFPKKACGVAGSRIKLAQQNN